MRPAATSPAPATAAYCAVEVQGQLQSGCLLTGFMQTHSCANTAPYTQFVGMRVD